MPEHTVTTVSGRKVPFFLPPLELVHFVPHLLGLEPKDLRDIPARALALPAESLPPSVQLPRILPVRDQQARGSCVGFATSALLEMLMFRETGARLPLSALDAYYLGRLVDGSTPVDCGTFVRSALKGARKFGVAPEQLWQYDGYGMKFASMPDPPARLQATFNAHGFTYVKLESLADMKASIAAGYGFAGIWTLFENVYQNAWLGNIEMPKPFEGARGAHATFFCGYDDATQRFTLKNSWGTQFGDGGYFTMPYSFFTIGELNDCWSVRPLI